MVRSSSVVRGLLALARLVGFGAALGAFVVWGVVFVGDARVLGEDWGITPATLIQDAIMAALALVAAWASVRGAALILVAISTVSFVPVGLYMMLLGGTYGLVGVCNLLCGAAGLLMAVCVRLPGAERRGALRQGV